MTAAFPFLFAIQSYHITVFIVTEALFHIMYHDPDGGNEARQFYR